MRNRVMLTGLTLTVCFAASLAVAQTQTAPTSAATPPPLASERPSSSNKWRIKFDERSKSDGKIVFRLWPEIGEPIDITVEVRQHQAENSIAQATRDAMRTKLGKAYKVEVDDGEDVLVKEGRGKSRFGLQLLSSSAQDVDIRIHKE